MKKQLSIQESADYKGFVIGIASDDRIWKLAHLLNQVLQIRLQPQPESGDKAGIFLDETQPQTSLFSAADLNWSGQATEYYIDDQSLPKCEICLSSGAGRKMPPETRPFSAFLLLRYISTPPIDLSDWLRRAQTITAIHSAVDLSNVRNLINLLP